MLENRLLLFREQNPYTRDFAGRGKIFLHHLCTGARASYGVNHINRLFEENLNEDSLLERMIMTMHALQVRHPDVFGKYKYAETEYPEKYRLLVEGLSDKALDAIVKIDVSRVAKAEPADLGQQFVDGILADRAALDHNFIPVTHAEIPSEQLTL